MKSSTRATRLGKAIDHALEVAEVVLMLSAVTICLMIVVKAGNYASATASQATASQAAASEATASGGTATKAGATPLHDLVRALP